MKKTKEIVHVNPTQLELFFGKTPEELEKWLFKGVEDGQWYAIQFFYAMTTAFSAFEKLTELNGGRFDWDNPDIEVPVPFEFPDEMLYEIEWKRERIDSFFFRGGKLYLVTPEE